MLLGLKLHKRKGSILKILVPMGGSLMVELLEWASHGHGMNCHDLDVMGSYPSWV